MTNRIRKIIWRIIIPYSKRNLSDSVFGMIRWNSQVSAMCSILSSYNRKDDQLNRTTVNRANRQKVCVQLASSNKLHVPNPTSRNWTSDQSLVAASARWIREHLAVFAGAPECRLPWIAWWGSLILDARSSYFCSFGVSSSESVSFYSDVSSVPFLRSSMTNWAARFSQKYVFWISCSIIDCLWSDLLFLVSIQDFFFSGYLRLCNSYQTLSYSRIGCQRFAITGPRRCRE